MAPPWIARSILALLALEVGLCAAFRSDHWAPLQQRENSLAHFFLGATRDDRAFVLDESPISQRSRLVRPLEKGTAKSYLRIDITDDPKPIFEEHPPSATDWAVILNNARKMGCATAAIDHPLTWDKAGEIPLRALDFELSTFNRSVLCVDLRRDADARAEPVVWTLIAEGEAEGVPPGRRNGCMVFDDDLTRLYVFGGTPDAQTSAPAAEPTAGLPSHAARCRVNAALVPTSPYCPLNSLTSSSIAKSGLSGKRCAAV